MIYYNEKGKYYGDENGNFSNVEFFKTKKKALQAIKSLKNCSFCMNCENCESCDCCRYCYGSKNLNYESVYLGQKPRPAPSVPSIHQKIWKIAKDGMHFSMAYWHSDCGTSHCWGGWAIHLAGPEAERFSLALGPAQAALLIFEASSPIEVKEEWFYEGKEKAIELIRELAEKEKELEAARKL